MTSRLYVTLSLLVAGQMMMVVDCVIDVDDDERRLPPFSAISGQSRH